MERHTRKICLLAIGSLFLGLLNALIYSAAIRGFIAFDLYLWKYVTLYSVANAFLIICIYHIGHLLTNNKLRSAKLNKFFSSYKWRCLVMLFAWLPYMILLYPGLIWYDTSNQLLQFFGMQNLFSSGAITQNHPPFDTLIFGVEASLGKLLFGNSSLFLYIGALINAILVILLVNLLIQVFLNRGKNTYLLFGIYLLISFNPIYVTSAISIVKDGINLSPTLALFYYFVEMYYTKGKVFDKKLQIVCFALACFIFVLTKKPSAYSLAICTVMGLPFYKGAHKGKVFATLLAATIFGAMLLPNYIYPAMGITIKTSQDPYAVPVQQVSRIVNKYRDEISSEDIELLDKMFEGRVLTKYYPYNSDEVKGLVYDNSKDIYWPEFRKLWLKLIKRHPLTAVEGALLNEASWFYFPTPSTYMNADVWADTIYTPQLSIYVWLGGVAHPVLFPEGMQFQSGNLALASSLEDGLNQFFSSSVFTPFFMRYFWTTFPAVFIFGIIVLFKRKDLALLYVVFLGILAAVYFSPTSIGTESLRYLFPVYYLMPFMYYIIFSVRRNVTEKSSN